MKKLYATITILLFNMSINGQSNQSTQNLLAFSKAFGYVKYFHPSDEAYELDWNTFSAYGARQVENCKNNKELADALNKLFAPIAPSVRFQLKKQQTPYNNQLLIPRDSSNYQPIYWQHKGVDFNMVHKKGSYSPYQSIRVNKSQKQDQSSPFGNIMTSIDPTDIKGKVFKYEGWAKLKADSEGQGQFWIRVDKPDKKVGFFNNSKDNPIKSDQWKKFEITGTIDEDAKGIVLGCFLLGKGTLWFDQLKFSIKEDDQWVEVPIKNSDFETEDIKIGRQASSLKWMGLGNGYEFCRTQNESYTSTNSAQIKYKGVYDIKEGDPLFFCGPEFGQLIEKEIVDGVICQIPLVLYGIIDSTYPMADKDQLSLLTSEIKNTSIAPEDVYTRIGNIITCYNIFQHFYPYFEVVEVDWQQELIKAIEQSYTDKNGNDHLKTLQQLTATLKDGHIRVQSPFNKSYIPPILWEWIENKLVITHVEDKNLSIKPGDIVEKINNISPEEFFAQTCTYISAATIGYLNLIASKRSLYGEEGSTLQLSINQTDYTLKRNYKYYDVYRNQEKPKYTYHFYHDSSIVYLNLDKIEMDTIQSLMPVLKNSKAIICDLRGYPNGNHDFISHLLKEDDQDGAWMQVPQIIYPDYENLCGFEKHGWHLKAKEPYLGDKQILFLTNEQAISYAESYMSFIEGYKLATIIGQPTAGTNGNVNTFELLGGYKIRFTGMKVIKHDGSQLHGTGIIPDVIINKTIAGIKEGRDEYLQKAFEMISTL